MLKELDFTKDNLSDFVVISKRIIAMGSETGICGLLLG